MSVIRKAQQGTNLNTTKHSPLSCNEYRPFWISWGGGVIRCGTGLTVGENTYMIYDDPNPTEVNKVAISTGFGATGNWQFLFYSKWESMLLGLADSLSDNITIQEVRLDTSKATVKILKIGTP